MALMASSNMLVAQEATTEGRAIAEVTAGFGLLDPNAGSFGEQQTAKVETKKTPSLDGSLVIFGQPFQRILLLEAGWTQRDLAFDQHGTTVIKKDYRSRKIIKTAGVITFLFP